MKPIVIAEIGWNWMGDLDLAKAMIIAAHDAGATYAKFQTWSVSRLKPGPWDNDGRREIYEKAELTEEKHIEIIKICKEVGIIFLSSVFSIPDAELLVKLGVQEVKIPSFESRNKELIEYCNDNFNQIYMSTGTSTLSEINDSLPIQIKSNFCLLHCVSSYPGSYESGNLVKMKRLKILGYPIGYSDHIMGVESAKIAIGEGAMVIEKHFTIDRNLPGRDNKFAILPDDLRDLTEYINNREKMLSLNCSDIHPTELDSREIYTGRFNG